MITFGTKRFLHSKIKNINEVRVPGGILLFTLFLLISLKGTGQRICPNNPTVTLSSSSGSTCISEAITVSGNIFGGSATSVILTENGNGYVVPVYRSVSPFSFTYTPGKKDVGRDVTITVTTNNPLGGACRAARATYILSVNSGLSVPVIGTITQPTCIVSTGSVELSGLPPTGEWTITMSPGGTTKTGTGTVTKITSIPPGTYTFRVMLPSGCISPSSESVVIHDQPLTPSAPLIGLITPPTCITPTGSVSLTGLPSPDTWTLTRYPESVITTGTGTSATISGLTEGTYYYIVTNQSGCISLLSVNVIIPVPPSIPPAPLVGTIIQPTIAVPTGSVILNGLPSSGPWIITRFPGEVITSGTGTTIAITGLLAGIYTFTVTDAVGCTSGASTEVIISSPEIPTLVITDPQVVCYPATVDLTAPEIKAGSTPGLIYSYWTDAEAAIPYNTPSIASEGPYYIKGTAASGYSDVKPVIVTIDHIPVANAGPDQILYNQFSTTLDAELNGNETGVWSLISGSGEFVDVTDPGTIAGGLSAGENILLWTVTNGVCPSSSDQVSFRITDLIIPTLITPNGDQMNEYFKIRGIENYTRTELVIFDRRGIQVYIKSNYDNKWNGVDHNGDPLPCDTYYFILKVEEGKTYNGYVVIKR